MRRVHVQTETAECTWMQETGEVKDRDIASCSLAKGSHGLISQCCCRVVTVFCRRAKPRNLHTYQHTQRRTSHPSPLSAGTRIIFHRGSLFSRHRHPARIYNTDSPLMIRVSPACTARVLRNDCRDPEEGISRPTNTMMILEEVGTLVNQSGLSRKSSIDMLVRI